MNAIDELIREFAPVAEDDAPERVAGEIARAKLRRAIADERRPGRRRWRRRWWPGIGLPVAAAGGLAAVILAVVALLPSHEANTPAPASAAVVLGRLAHVATRQPNEAYPGPHQYLYLKFQEGWTGSEAPANGAPFAFTTTDSQQDWVAPNGSGRQRRFPVGPARFLAARDRAAWLAAGKPGLVPPATDGTYAAGGYPDNCAEDPDGLPTNASALRAAIARRFDRGKSDASTIFLTAGCLLQNSGSPTLRGALYRMLAGLPGVRLLGSGVDALGRHGVVMGIMGIDGTRDQLVFDPATSDVLEEEQVQVRPDTTPVPAGVTATRRLPLGTVLHYVAYQGRGVVDSIEALPDGGRVPFHAG